MSTTSWIFTGIGIAVLVYAISLATYFHNHPVNKEKEDTGEVNRMMRNNLARIRRRGNGRIR